MSDLDATGLEILDREECVRLLAGATLGRVAVTMGALPSIFPVNYRVIDNRVVFSTGAGSKLAAALRHAVVAFEVDDIDEDAGEGWSVNVVGPASAEYGFHHHVEADLAGLRSLVPGPVPFIVEVEMALVTGRRIPPRSDHRGFGRAARMIAPEAPAR